MGQQCINATNSRSKYETRDSKTQEKSEKEPQSNDFNKRFNDWLNITKNQEDQKKKKIIYTKHEQLPGVLVIGDIDFSPISSNGLSSSNLVNSTPKVIVPRPISTKASTQSFKRISFSPTLRSEIS
jgi:hypothetical protein